MSAKPKLVRIVIAGEHSIFRHGLRRLLEGEAGMSIVGEIPHGTPVLPLIKELEPDILLLGLQRATRAADTIRDLSPLMTRTVILTDRVDNPEVIAALERGARAVVPKDSAPEVLFKSIEAVMAGQFWIGKEQPAGAVQSLRKLEATRRRNKAFGLTRREIEIIRAIVAGCTNKEIAERASITENTVKAHLTHIFNKLGASNRVELALFASHHRLLDGV